MSLAQFYRVFASALFFVAIAGCNKSRYVTHAQLDRAMATIGVDHVSINPYPAAMTDAERQRQVSQLVDEAFNGNSPAARSLAALAAADSATEPLQKTLQAIHAAEAIVLQNISNAETNAYKATHTVVMDGKLVQQFDVDQGSMESTNRPLDVGIQGNGYFAIGILDSLGGTGYTRNGNFFINNKGEIVLGMGDGYKLIPPITVPLNATEIGVTVDGIVQYCEAGSQDRHTAGQIMLAQFRNPQWLKLAGGSIYTMTDASGPPVVSKPGNNGAGQLLSDFLESSNVDLDRERVRLRWLIQWRQTLELSIAEQMSKLSAQTAGYSAAH